MNGPQRTPAQAGERLAKTIARAGYCSRRDAERLIAEGRVAVSGKTVRTPAFNVTGEERITIDGQSLETRRKTRLWLYHKPTGLVVTERDPEGRRTVFEVLKEQGLPRVLSVGRLDINTEGLLLLTNDGGLKRVLELPETGWLRKYRVRAHGTVTQQALDKLKEGVTVDGVKYGAIEASFERQQGANVWLQLALREGKNREVKNVLGTLGLQVNRLIRISYGPFQLGDLPLGGVTLVRNRVLRDQLGQKLAQQAGIDFDADLPDIEPAATATPEKRAVNPNARIGRNPKASPPRRAKRFGSGKDETDNRPKFDRQGRPERPARAPKPAPEPRMGRVHYDDGRASEDMVLKAKRAPRKDGTDERRPRQSEGRPQAGQARPGFGDRKGPPREDRQERGSGKRPFDAKPAAGKSGPARGAGRGKPDDRSSNRPGGRPGERPAGRPQNRAAKPFGKPSSKSSSKSSSKPSGKPSSGRPGPRKG